MAAAAGVASSALAAAFFADGLGDAALRAGEADGGRDGAGDVLGREDFVGVLVRGGMMASDSLDSIAKDSDQLQKLYEFGSHECPARHSVPRVCPDSAELFNGTLF
jgi:hypothetical protein